MPHQRTTTTHERIILPADEESFDLLINHENLDPMDIVRIVGHHRVDDWKYLGPIFTGTHLYQVKLVRLGRVTNLQDARQRASQRGCRLLEGQGIIAFREKFPHADGFNPITFGGSEWERPNKRPAVTCLYTMNNDWDPYFRWSESNFHENYLWALVEQEIPPQS